MTIGAMAQRGKALEAGFSIDPGEEVAEGELLGLGLGLVAEPWGTGTGGGGGLVAGVAVVTTVASGAGEEDAPEVGAEVGAEVGEEGGSVGLPLVAGAEVAEVSGTWVEGEEAEVGGLEAAVEAGPGGVDRRGLRHSCCVVLGSVRTYLNVAQRQRGGGGVSLAGRQA